MTEPIACPAFKLVGGSEIKSVRAGRLQRRQGLRRFHELHVEIGPVEFQVALVQPERGRAGVPAISAPRFGAIRLSLRGLGRGVGMTGADLLWAGLRGDRIL